jgi:hypothetical protein
MPKHLPSSVFSILLLASCASASHQTKDLDASFRNHFSNTQPVTSSFEDVDTTFIMTDSFTSAQTPVPLTDLPRTETRAFVLAPGFYETDFKTYCLQPGNPAPSGKDVYFQAPLKGARKDIIETILRNSQTESNLEQRNIQLLLWSVVSRSDFSKLSPSVQATAWQLLSPKQVFELKGGVMGVVKTVADVLPASTGAANVQHLFDLGVTSYEAYERLAVPSGTSEVTRPDFKRGQWYKHSDGYYVRYFPSGYQQTKIQVYVPEGTTASSASDTANYMVFDPVSFVVVPANSNAQRLGVGAPVKDVVRSVIRVMETTKKPKQPSNPTKDSKNTPPAKAPKMKN